MAARKNIDELAHKVVKQERTQVDAIEAKRLRLAAALKAAEGLWKDRTDIPKDGVQYQERLRSEWH